MKNYTILNETMGDTLTVYLNFFDGTNKLLDNVRDFFTEIETSSILFVFNDYSSRRYINVKSINIIMD